jgi:hypothetical protein
MQAQAMHACTCLSLWRPPECHGGSWQPRTLLTTALCRSLDVAAAVLLTHSVPTLSTSFCPACIASPDGFLGIVYLDLYRRPQKFPSAAHFTLRCGRELPGGTYQVRPACARLYLQLCTPLVCGCTPLVRRAEVLGGFCPGARRTICTVHCWLMRLCLICQLRPLACPRVLQTPVVALVANMAQHAGLSLGEVGGTSCPDSSHSDRKGCSGCPR